MLIMKVAMIIMMIIMTKMTKKMLENRPEDALDLLVLTVYSV